MKKIIVVIAAVLALTGCDRYAQRAETMVDGYTVRCVEGIKYIFRGEAISVLLKANGLPKECDGADF